MFSFKITLEGNNIPTASCIFRDVIPTINIVTLLARTSQELGHDLQTDKLFVLCNGQVVRNLNEKLLAFNLKANDINDIVCFL